MINLRKEVKIGIFVTAVLVASFFVINYLRGVDIFHREIELKGHFNDVEGLVPSAVVRIRGYEAGKVVSVTYRPEYDDFEVCCSVDRQFRIPSDSRMTVFSTSIMGGKGILIETGSSETAVCDGGELQTAVQPDLVETLAARIELVMNGLEETLDGLKQATHNVNAVLNEENRKNIDLSIAELRRTLSSVRHLAAGIDSRSGEIDTFITGLADVTEKLSSIAVKADSTMVSVGAFSKNLENTDVEGLVESITQLSGAIRNPDGTIGRLLEDGDIYNSADSLIAELTDLVAKIKENPKKYMKLSVF